MGWTTMYAPKDERAEILSLLVWPDSAPFTAEVLKLNKVGSLRFAAVKFTPKPGEELRASLKSSYEVAEDGSVTWCAIFLTNRYRGEWGYKDMTEDMGPVPPHCKAPASILKLLSPTTDEYALSFRKRCEAWNNRPRPKPGQTIKTAEPINYGNLGKIDTFTKVDHPRSRGVYRIPGGSLVRLNGDALLGARIVS